MKSLEKKQSWTKYATAEGVLKISHFAIYKSFGVAAQALAYQLLVTAVIGLVEMVFAGALARSRNYPFVPNTQAVFGALAFGLVGIWMTIVPIYALSQPGADLALFGFMTALSVLPGAVLDRLAFGDQPRAVHWLGVGLFLFASWAIQDFPSLAAMAAFPLWVILAYTFPIAAAINEALARYAGTKDLKPSVTTFWIGTAQFGVCGTWLLVAGLTHSDIVPDAFFSELTLTNWAMFAGLGFLIWLSHIAKQLAYAPGAGGTIVMKKILMISILLLGVLAFDALFLNAAPTTGEWVGFATFLLAMILVYRSD